MTAQKRRTIFALCRELGMDESARHLLQHSVTGKESLSEINDRQADDIIRTLRSQQQKNGYDAKKSLQPGNNINPRIHGAKIYNLMSQDQIKKIKAMSIRIYGDFVAEKMDAYCKRYFKKPFRRITSDEARLLIESQKKILTRKLREQEK